MKDDWSLLKPLRFPGEVKCLKAVLKPTTRKSEPGVSIDIGWSMQNSY